MAVKYSLRRALFPLAVVLGTSTAPLLPAAPVVGGAGLAAGMAAAGLPARALVGVGLGWLARGLRGEPIEPAALESAGPVVLRGDLGISRGPDPWGQQRQTLHVRSLRRGPKVVAGRLRVDIRSTDGVAPGRVRIKGWLRQRPDGGWALRVKDPRLASRVPATGPRAVLDRMRLDLRRSVDRRLQTLVQNDRRRALLRSLFLGRDQELDPGLQTTFRRLGLGHLFAVSGLHVGILAGVAWLLGCRGRAWRRRLGLVALVLGYVLVLDPRGSVVRAATVLVLWQAIELLGRRLDPLPALAICVAAVGLSAPGWFADLGLQLSVLAVVGILTLGVPLAAQLTPRWGWAGGLVAIGLGAQAAIIPLSAWRFHWLAPLAPLYGALAVPWAALVLTLTTVGVLSPLPGLTSVVIGPLVDGLLRVGAWMVDLPPNPVHGWPATAADGAVYAAGLALLIVASTSEIGGVAMRRWGAAAVGVIAVLSVVVPPRVHGLRLVMLDVGQGDSLLVQDGGDNMLIDGGSDGRRLLARLAEQGVRRVDALVVSHPDRDHCGGSVEVARWIPVASVWTPTGWRGDCYWRLLTLPGVRLEPMWAGRSRIWNGFRLEPLAPAAGGTRIDNDDSLVVRLAIGERAVLLTGDIEFRGERKLLRRVGCSGLESEILKVAHHGGGSSTRPELLRCVAPRVALVSSGAGNAYGHPTAEVLHRLAAFGIRVRRTDREGSVSIDLDNG